jgi:quinol monooxygenase YgiN
MNSNCPQGTVVELRQYTLHPGKRDTLIEIFDRELLEPQEALGMVVFGQFRDLDNPDRFVWLRGFRDMPSRAAALAAFYSGPVWKANGAAANATMVDSNNVLLLRPTWPNSGFAARQSAPESNALFVAAIYPLPEQAAEEFITAFDRLTARPIVAAGAEILGAFATEHSENTFPALPVREGENVFVILARLAEAGTYRRVATALLQAHHAPEILRLSPTARSHMQ